MLRSVFKNDNLLFSAGFILDSLHKKISLVYLTVSGSLLVWLGILTSGLDITGQLMFLTFGLLYGKRFGTTSFDVFFWHNRVLLN